MRHVVVQREKRQRKPTTCARTAPDNSIFKFNGTAVQWYYKGIEVARNEQFAVYDMNFVKSDYKSAVGAKANEVLVTFG